MKSQKKGKRDFATNVRFLIEGLQIRLMATRAKRGKVNEELLKLETRRNGLFHQQVQNLLPNLEARTIAKLKRDCPGFVTQKVQEAINAAGNVKVPWLTWCIGGSAKYKAEHADDQRGLLRAQLSHWLESQQKKPACLAEVLKLEAQAAPLRTRERELAKKEGLLKAEISRLERASELYARPGAHVPPKLEEAVAKGSTTLRDHEESYTTRSRNQDDFDVIRDVFIPQIIFDAVLHPRHEAERPYHNGRGNGHADTMEPASRHDRGGGMEVDTNNSGNADRGGGFQVSLDSDGHSDRGGGMEVSMSGRGDMS